MSTKQGPNENSSPTEQVTSVRLSPEDHAAFKQIAARENRSLSGQVRHWIQQQIREEREAA